MKYRIKDKKKFERFILISMVFIFLIIFSVINIFNLVYADTNSNNNSIIVKSGDTLWSIAESINTDRDIREIIFDIQKMNNITNSKIQPGNKLYIPSK